MFDNRKISANIKQLRTELNMSQTEFAKNLDMNTSNIRDLEIGKVKPSVELLYNIKEVFGIGADRLMFSAGGSMNRQANPHSDNRSAFEIRYFPDVAASAGGGAFVCGEECEPFFIDKSLVSDPESSAVISVTGTSMEPTLLDGDKILIDMNEDVLTKLLPDRIYVVRTDDTVIIKRYSGREGTVCYFSSDNKVYGQYRIDMSDDANKLIGILKAVVYRQTK